MNNVLQFSKWVNYNPYPVPIEVKGSVLPFRKEPYPASTIDEDQLLYMSFLLEEACDMKKLVLVTYQGRYTTRQFYGRVKKINPYEGWLIMVNGDLKKSISYSRLIDVEWV